MSGSVHSPQLGICKAGIQAHIHLETGGFALLSRGCNLWAANLQRPAG